MFCNELYRCRDNTLTMCEFPGSNGNGFGDIWWTDKLFHFSSIDISRNINKDATTKPRPTSYTIVSCKQLVQCPDVVNSTSKAHQIRKITSKHYCEIGLCKSNQKHWLQRGGR